MTNVPTLRVGILTDLLDGPKAGSVLRTGRSGYFWPSMHKMQLDGLVALDEDTRAYSITDKGRRWLDENRGRVE